MTIDELMNNCVLIALREVSGLPDQMILEAVRSHGYRNHRGMYQSDYHEAARDLGIQLGEVVAVRDLPVPDGDDFDRRWDRSLGKVLPLITDGVYLVRVRGHLLVARNGRMVDHNQGVRSRLRRRVVDVTKVLNPYTPRTEGFVRCVRRNPRHKGTGAWRRYEVMREYLARNKRTTKKELLANTAYRSDDFAWDLARGNITIV